MRSAIGSVIHALLGIVDAGPIGRPVGARQRRERAVAAYGHTTLPDRCRHYPERLAMTPSCMHPGRCGRFRRPLCARHTCNRKARCVMEVRAAFTIIRAAAAEGLRMLGTAADGWRPGWRLRSRYPADPTREHGPASAGSQGLSRDSAGRDLGAAHGACAQSLGSPSCPSGRDVHRGGGALSSRAAPAACPGCTARCASSRRVGMVTGPSMAT